MLIVFQNFAFHNALLADMPKCTQVCPHGAGEEDLAAEVPADPDPVPTASAADPMGKRGTGHWPLEHFSLNVTFWACLQSHCINRCSKHHRLRFQCSSNRILLLSVDVLGNRPETTNFFFFNWGLDRPRGHARVGPRPPGVSRRPHGQTWHGPLASGTFLAQCHVLGLFAITLHQQVFQAPSFKIPVLFK